VIIRRVGIIERTYRHAKRYRQILGVLIKYGFGDLVSRLNIENYVEVGLQMVWKEDWEGLEDLSRGERIRNALEELGPTFIKLGQVLSTHHSYIPLDIYRELEKLQDEVAPFPLKDVNRIIEEELGLSIEDLFDEFEDQPIAAASIGQVHSARLKSGEWVVIKVQRPNIRKMVQVDIEIMFHIATLMERHVEGWDLHNPTGVVEEFSRTIQNEIDYGVEAAHIERFAGMFLEDERVHIPEVYHDFSTDRVLTMEYMEGIKPSQSEELDRRGYDKQLIGERGFNLILRMVFEYGYFHADPHPGNILVMPGNVIGFLDFGMVGQLSRREREHFTDLIIAIAQRDEVMGREVFMRITEWENEPNRDELEKRIDAFMSQHFHKSLKRINLGKLLREMVNISAEFQMRLPPDLLLVIKTFTAVDGVGRMLDPNFNPVQLAEPFLKHRKRQRHSPRHILAQAYAMGTDLVEFVSEIPTEMREVFRLVKSGRIKMEFEHRGLDPLLSTLERVSSRLSLAILVGSLVIGSSVIVLSGVPPKWADMPVIGIIGYLLAGILSLAIIVSILRSGHH